MQHFLFAVHHNHAPSQHRGSTSSESNLEQEKSSRTSQTQSFVNELMQLLRCDNETVGVQLRETVKEMVSYELSPPVYSYLFQCMTDEMTKVINWLMIFITTCPKRYNNIIVV